MELLKMIMLILVTSASITCFIMLWNIYQHVLDIWAMCDDTMQQHVKLDAEIEAQNTAIGALRKVVLETNPQEQTEDEAKADRERREQNERLLSAIGNILNYDIDAPKDGGK